MEIDRKIIKILAVDTRTDILKSLTKRRKLLSELSRELGFANSTIMEHLAKLQEAGLIKRLDTGHKWIYYELTPKGRELVSPSGYTNSFVILLSLGIIILFTSFTMPGVYLTSLGQADMMTTEGKSTPIIPTQDITPVLIAFLGVILIISSFVKFGLDRRKILSL